MSTAALPFSQRRVFVATAAYLALLDERDEHHAEVVTIITQLAAAHYRVFTTNTVLIEAYSLILSVLGRTVALRFLHDIEESRTVVVRTRVQDEERARTILEHYQDKAFSFVDAISFAVMERLGISRAFTFDCHFAQYGFTVLSTEGR